jgi:hypothetical protein
VKVLHRLVGDYREIAPISGCTDQAKILVGTAAKLLGFTG